MPFCISTRNRWKKRVHEQLKVTGSSYIDFGEVFFFEPVSSIVKRAERVSPVTPASRRNGVGERFRLKNKPFRQSECLSWPHAGDVVRIRRHVLQNRPKRRGVSSFGNESGRRRAVYRSVRHFTRSFVTRTRA